MMIEGSKILNVELLVQPPGYAFVLQLHLEVVESPFLSALVLPSWRLLARIESSTHNNRGLYLYLDIQ